eukprot:gnl/MRDRNA2_/MRDRNA2_143503_c0_seq1.p1 gnl/MRDRNA2_/MRDRNA2_143503_c0~~gnl/MRDRNA2_/MRDRNA2_143503_c0_seq1.p1  ORF type:complete len:590 (-),score=31.60 gnl/MRDRNA2_/MRDRNA2_143503_c0_seq1:3-1772(-)
MRTRMSKYIYIACVFTALAGPVTEHLLSPNCSIADTGSTCRDDASKAAAACNARPQVPCKIVFESGIYLWNATLGPVLFRSVISVSIIVDPAGAEIHTFGMELHGLFAFVDIGGGVLIEGPMSVDAVRQPYTYGKVTAVTTSNVTVSFDENEYPFYSPFSAQGKSTPWLDNAEYLYGAIDAELRVPKLPMYWGTGGKLNLIGDGVLSVSRTLFNPKFINEWIVIEHARQAEPAFDFHRCTGVTIQGLTLYSHAGFGVMMTQVHNAMLANVSVVAKGSRPMSIMADGAHFRKCSGELRISDSTFERNGDDGFASHSEYSYVVALVDPTCIHVDGKGIGEANIGESWVFRDRATLRLLGARQVVGIDHLGKKMRFNDTLPSGLKVNDVLTSTTHPLAVIERSRFWGNLGHGIRIKTPDVVVRDCELGYNSYGSILMLPDAAKWMSSMVVSNVTIEGCTITNGDPWATAQYDTDPASIVVTAYVPAEVPRDGNVSGKMPLKVGMVNDRITIRNNIFVQAPGVCTAVLFRATSNYEVENNTFLWASGTRDGCPAVHALNSQGSVHGNACFLLNSSAYPCQTQQIDQGGEYLYV